MSDEPRACPFCGGQSYLVDAGPVEDEPSFTRVACWNCDVVLDREDKAQALAAWNRRATPAADRDAVLEEAAQACDWLETRLVQANTARESYGARESAFNIRALKATPAPINHDAAAELGEILREVEAEPYFVPPPWTVTACICTWPNGCPGRAKLDPACKYGNHARLAGKSTPAPITPSAVDEAERRGAERERAAVVAWLRGYYGPGSTTKNAAEDIEAGYHIPPATESEGKPGE